MSRAAAVYQTLPANDRQEFRLPALLKEHLQQVAALRGQTLTEYVTTTLAEQVTQDLAEATLWTLAVDEQVTLLKLLANPREPSEYARNLAAQADALFGPLTKP